MVTRNNLQPSPQTIKEVKEVKEKAIKSGEIIKK